MYISTGTAAKQYDVQRELRWLMEDAVEQPWPLGLHRNGEQDPVNLRLTIPDLHMLWDRRLKERRAIQAVTALCCSFTTLTKKLSNELCVLRVPLQYLTHSAHWRDLVLAVGPGVLIPRPETECLIEFALEVLVCRQLCWSLAAVQLPSWLCPFISQHKLRMLRRRWQCSLLLHLASGPTSALVVAHLPSASQRLSLRSSRHALI